MEQVHQNIESVKSKIKKLLALSDKTKNSSISEAENALKKAQELMMRFNIEERDVLKKVSDLDIVEEFYEMESKSIDKHWEVASGIIQKFFLVEVVYHRDSNGVYTLKIIGQKHNVDIAEGVWDFIVEEIARIWKIQRKEYKAEGKSLHWKSFCLGIHSGLSDKLERGQKSIQKENQEWGLVVVDDKRAREKYLTEKFPNLKHRSIRSSTLDSDSYETGKREGSRIKLRTQVKSGNTKSLS